ncbi:MAG: DUF535 family protein [Rudaea sp.]|uniref:VirK/YbjX family protein n=1 Tax=unclassified Rudaea TaxID=2627037 RepID=UPI00148508BF|nr:MULTISPECIES: DUF535 family protein [unclassified Rudaea]MBN8884762.1 DUF535 family protein [Rudaea sp.]MBR0347253.1 DUF535 family protein [Rudaea sp.]
MTIEPRSQTLTPLQAWLTPVATDPEKPRRATLLDYARRAYPSGHKRLLKRARFLVRALGHYRLHDAWLQLLEAPALGPMIARTPQFCAKIQHDYVIAGIGTAGRLTLASGHFDTFLHRVPRILTAAIYVGSGLRIASIETAENCYELRLLHLPHCWQEGEVSIGLFEDSHLIGSLTFVLGGSHDFSRSLPPGESAMAIGGIQGLHDGDGQNVFRRATKSMHGLRPFSLLIHAARTVARSLGATRVLAVADARHALRYKRSKGKIRLSYDTIWLDHSATAVDMGVFDLGLVTVTKDLADIPSQKRAQYRRRYALTDTVDAEIRAVLKLCG